MPPLNELTFLSDAASANSAVQKYTANEILALNEKTAKRGLALSEMDALELAETRRRALYENSRVEIGLGAVERLIDTFSKSTFATSENWAEILNSAAENFYFVKTEVHDLISDKELAGYMYREFETYCGGSLELLSDRCEALISRINRGANVFADNVGKETRDE